MARASSNKLYRTFVKGLVTEASPLTYPEDASFDELNTVLSRRGSRTRRLGIDYLENTITASLETTDKQISQNEYVWSAVAEQSDKNFLVVQKGFNVNFFDMSTNTSADSFKSFSIDLQAYVIAGQSTIEAERHIVQFASGKGFLFIVSRLIEPVVVEYDIESDDITVSRLRILIRDFDGLDDNLANDEEPTTLTKEHHYNLMNQGWLYGSASSETFSTKAYADYVLNAETYRYNEVNYGSLTQQYSTATPETSPITLFYNEIGRYPGNNKQWWVARAEADNPDEGIEAGDFLPEVLDKLYSGNNRAPNGHFIVDAFNIDRSAISGISGLPVITKKFRPEAITFYSGRAWYAAGSIVYYSQILDSSGIKKAALCYQEADPTSEDISDLIASDGGVVPIPEASRIRRLIPMGNGVLVFAQNGVWFISGGDSAFSAANISLGKVSSIGTKSPLAAIEVDGTLFWWSEIGIDAMQQASGQFGPIPGKFGNSSVSEQTIQTLVNEIGPQQRQNIKSMYDPRNNRVMWMYNDGELSGQWEYNKILVFDMTLQAFFPWKFDNSLNGPIINGIYNNIGEAYSTEETEVIDSLGNTVENKAEETIVVSIPQAAYSPSSIQYLVNIPSQGMAIAELSNTNYVDWETFDDEGLTYDSYVETGYELMGDSMRDKQMLYVFCHFEQAPNSSCKMRVKWDWSDSPGSNRWSTEVEAYRDQTTDLDGFAVVTSKNKVRGSGKSAQFRFGTSEAGKNFNLFGWSVAYSGNTQP